MFNIKDYIYYDFKDGIYWKTIDKEKIHNEIEEFKENLLNLENLIGPFKIKVINGKVKLKTRDDF